MNWTHDVLTRPGIYLRSLGKRIFRQDVALINGILYTRSNNDNFNELAKWKKAETFWWLGPIPEIPK